MALVSVACATDEAESEDSVSGALGEMCDDGDVSACRLVGELRFRGSEGAKGTDPVAVDAACWATGQAHGALQPGNIEVQMFRSTSCHRGNALACEMMCATGGWLCAEEGTPIAQAP